MRCCVGIHSQQIHWHQFNGSAFSRLNDMKQASAQKMLGCGLLYAKRKKNKQNNEDITEYKDHCLQQGGVFSFLFSETFAYSCLTNSQTMSITASIFHNRILVVVFFSYGTTNAFNIHVRHIRYGFQSKLIHSNRCGALSIVIDMTCLKIMNLI